MILWFLNKLASASPEIAFPVNSQVPPVARIDQPFQFTFSASTFCNTSSRVQYITVGTPAWLHLDSPSRTFSGTPSVNDIGAADFSLVATDETGTTSMSVTFIVSSKEGPGFGMPLAEQLPALGTFSSPDNLIFYPSSPISISFRPDTFKNTNDDTVYYAICANNTPLPSWIRFDSKGLSFTGNTPGFSSEFELPQRFGIHLIASDIVGFSTAAASFTIVVESHELVFISTLAIQVVAGQTVNFNGIKSSLRLDGQPIDAIHIRTITANPPPWLVLDDASMMVSGVVPQGVSSQSFSVAVGDIYGDNVNATIMISASGATNLIHGSIAPLHAVLGTAFGYQFNRTLFRQDSIIQMDLGNLSSWLKFDEASLKLSGQVPIDLKPQTNWLNITVSQGTTSSSETLALIISRELKSTTATLSTSLRPTASSTKASGHGPTTQVSSDGNSDTESNRQRVAAAIVLPIVIILALLLLVWWVRNRRQRQYDQKHEQTIRQQIGRPELPRMLEPPRIDFIPELRLSDVREGQAKQPPLQRDSATDPPKRGSGQGSMRPWSRLFYMSADKHDHPNTPEYSIAEDRRDQSTLAACSSVCRSHRKVPSNPIFLASNSSYQRSLNTAIALGTSFHPNGFGHGYPVRGPSLPARDIPWTNRRDSNMSSLLVSGNGRDIPSHQNAALYGNGMPRTSQKACMNREESVGWYTISDSATIPTNQDRPSSKPSSSTRASAIYRDPEERPTIRAVGSIKDIKESPRRRQEKYLKTRRKVPQTYSALFSNNASLRKTSSSLIQNLHMLQNSSSWTDDDPYIFNDKENLSSSFSRSVTLAQRKGKRMQQRRSFSFSPNHDMRVTPSQLGYGAPPRLRHFQSRSSMASSRRFENAESEISSNVDEEEYTFEQWGQQGDEGSKRRWVHAKHKSPLQPAYEDAAGSELPRSGRRWDILDTQKGAMRKEENAEGGETAGEEKDKKLVLGERGKRPVSVENQLDRVRGAPGSKSFRAESAFV